MNTIPTLADVMMAQAQAQAKPLCGEKLETGIESIISRINVATARVIDAAARAERVANLTVGPEAGPGVEGGTRPSPLAAFSAMDHLDDLAAAISRLECHLHRMT